MIKQEYRGMYYPEDRGFFIVSDSQTKASLELRKYCKEHKDLFVYAYYIGLQYGELIPNLEYVIEIMIDKCPPSESCLYFARLISWPGKHKGEHCGI